MKIRQANLADLKTVTEIVQHTINAIYPRYYPAGAVDFFLSYHDGASISDDIAAQCVYIIEADGVMVGTVTVKGAEISRIYVPPERQGNGYGAALFDFAEQKVAAAHDKIRVEASLPAKAFYLKRGYREIEYFTYLTESGDYLAYDVMEKSVS